MNENAKKILIDDSMSVTRTCHVLDNPKTFSGNMKCLPDMRKKQELPCPHDTTNCARCDDETQQKTQSEIADEDHLAAKAATIAYNVSSNSKLFDIKMENQVPRFEHSELRLGSLLGRGGFNDVSEISSVNPKVRNNSIYGLRQLAQTHSVVRNSLTGEYYKRNPNSPARSISAQSKSKIYDEEDKITDTVFKMSESIYDNLHCEEEDLEDQIHGRNFISKQCIRNGDARYAFKTLSSQLVNDPEQWYAGLVDLAIEARFLAVVKHPHIIKMRAMSLGDPFKPGFFIVLDRLYDTLSKRIWHWGVKEKKNKCLLNKLTRKTRRKNDTLWIERLSVAYDLSSAMQYLHTKNILFRDLKPDNIGFDIRGDVKIFDFGLAVELHDKYQNTDGSYNLSGNTGTLRYMAPEVELGLPYSRGSDVYSFGILLWQMLSTKKPFDEYTVKMHHELVIMRNVRPEILSTWSVAIVALLKTSWHVDVSLRPTFEEISTSLCRDIHFLKEDISKGLGPINKSEHSLP